ncbi:hypothetical protein KIN20_021722 [Parelaphostrongylus tenuis]|uniref:Uncharacterized protein n=1 Tax=Parelaphostrongylus tenuis TaxID=148309 RepID=A0AAD5QUC6_PARTN|nr:hypothetical protein KIN20_021722 [Parelaphostrongylus tenuis]
MGNATCSSFQNKVDHTFEARKTLNSSQPIFICKRQLLSTTTVAVISQVNILLKHGKIFTRNS